MRAKLISITLLLLAAVSHAEEWRQAAPMNETRQYPGLAYLPGGRILAVTGHPLNGKSLSGADIYDPASDTWTPTGALNLPRNGVQPGGLINLSNGQILIAGGGTGSRSIHEAELYDPDSETWSFTGPMALQRCVHTSTLLQDGRVLVTGGIDWTTNEIHASAELYDPETGTWRSTGAMKTARWNHRAVRLDDGRVLIVGGATEESGDEAVLASAEIFDPRTESWKEIAPMHHGRRAPGMALLHDGRAIVIGGKSAVGPRRRDRAEVEVFDPATETWTDVAPLRESRWGPSAIVLRDGQVLVTGGMYGSSGRRRSAERFDPIRGEWRRAGGLEQARNGHRSITLASGQILICGGFSGRDYLSSCEIYVP